MKLSPVFLLVFLAICGTVSAQQVPDFQFDPKISNPLYTNQNGPVVVVDEAHHNFHIIKSRYNAFAKVLTLDGYRVKPGTRLFSAESLSGVKILVIANALNAANENEWSKPTPSAFTPDEIEAVNKWVKEGGSLFLIADHMPFPGANEALAATFGFKLYNGFATDTTAAPFPGSKKGPDIFKKSDASLASHVITNGKSKAESIDHLATFTGQGFEIPGKAVSLITFNDKYKIFLPDTAWKFNEATPRLPIKGFSQGAVLNYYKGKVAVFGEAAMFSSQVTGKDRVPMGLSHPEAGQNVQFLLNLIHWLD
ncbi:DUF4350 domain-containing protein [Dyadobacter sp. NIV53]|uniref:DUF4350 domain-containing protein n=1 Tax=Dyadobacter sp. NIV53 TaxID=2861765 RepID=UPI001C87F60E|nr:DUF4350 domain-containing protein [Dyadobacter sp. NIV53]